MRALIRLGTAWTRIESARFKTHRVVLALCCTVGAWTPALGAQAPTDLEAVNATVDAIFHDVDGEDTPGAAVAVVRGEDVIYMKGFGMANLEHGVPITPETVFDIASISKQFGAMTAILAEQDGVIGFDDEAAEYVSELPSIARAITLRQLIHHTSGLRDWPHLMVLSGVGMGDVISFDHIKKMLWRQDALNFPEGSAYAYSNTGYNLLAEALARASGKRFRELTQERIFGPLEMRRTHFQDDHTEIIPGRASSYEPGEAHAFKNSINQLTALASSSLHTTMEDFTRWMTNFETKRVGGEKGLDTLQRRGVLIDGTKIPYAFGLVHGDYRGLETVGHGGSWRGFRTHFLRFPDHGLSIAVFANFSTADPAARARRIADVYLADAMEASEEVPERERTVEILDLSAAELSEFTGEFYSRELDTTYELRVIDDKLVATHWRNESVTLDPVGPDRFNGRTWWFRDIAFERNDAGEPDVFALSGGRVMGLRFIRR